MPFLFSANMDQKTKTNSLFLKAKRYAQKIKQAFNGHLDRFSFYYRLLNVGSIVVGFLVALFSYSAVGFLIYPILLVLALVIRPSLFYYFIYFLLLLLLSLSAKVFLLNHAGFTVKLLVLMGQWQNWFL